MDSQILEEVIRSGNIPCHGRTGMLCSGGGLLPPALLDEAKVPKFYLDAISACGANTSTSLPNTALVYNLMNTSGLQKDVLSYIWSAVNRAKPGQLTRPEFFSLMALIALAQKGESLAALCAKDSLPIPYLNPVQSFPSSAPTTSSFIPPLSKIKQTTSAFIPTSLLPRKSMRKKKETDLIKDLNSPTTPQSNNSSPSKQGAARDLMGLNFGAENIKDENRETQSETPTIRCWRETIHAIFLIFQEANDLLGKAKNSIIEEVVSTEKGENYMKSLSLASEILERVCRSAGVSLPTQSTSEAEACRKCWKRLSPFLSNNEGIQRNEDESRKCAICCQNIINGIDYGGQVYDVMCANLWVNNVSSMLPNQHLKL
ncbi:unnamed protein product [Caenorhabditis angaria]|uniref:EH domain-containing protein n=1 Tax=Caenorhabditis angaria TaxID=860376 RepID=A0A9P1IG04_9PELO|nr:unnamed protein product [Caenorhabditis angaria]